MATHYMLCQSNHHACRRHHSLKSGMPVFPTSSISLVRRHQSMKASYPLSDIREPVSIHHRRYISLASSLSISLSLSNILQADYTTVSSHCQVFSAIILHIGDTDIELNKSSETTCTSELHRETIKPQVLCSSIGSYVPLNGV